MTTTWGDVYFDKVPLAGSPTRKRYFAHAFAFCHSLLKLPPEIFRDKIVHWPWKIFSSFLLGYLPQFLKNEKNKDFILGLLQNKKEIASFREK